MANVKTEKNNSDGKNDEEAAGVPSAAIDGIARTLPSFLLYIFKFLDSRCWPLVSLSDNLNSFQRYRG